MGSSAPKVRSATKITAMAEVKVVFPLLLAKNAPKVRYAAKVTARAKAKVTARAKVKVS